MKTLTVIFIWLPAFLTSEDTWSIFERVKFVVKYDKGYNEFFMFPEFEKEIKSLEGKEISLSGYYVPFDLTTPNAVVISKYPYAACFFCGGAGPESVAEVVFTSKRPKFKLDQFVTVTGKLKLNGTNVDRMTFIFEDAKIISK